MASVPSSGTSNAIGTPEKAVTDSVVKAPTGAKYLIISKAISNTTNKVAYCTSIGDSIKTRISPMLYEDYTNIFDGYVEDGVFDSNGDVDSTSYVRTDYIPVSFGKYIVDIAGGYVYDLGFGFGLASFYDKDKNILEYENYYKSAGTYSGNAAPKVFQIKNHHTAYMRFSVEKSRFFPNVNCIFELDNTISKMSDMPAYVANKNTNHKYVDKKLNELDWLSNTSLYSLLPIESGTFDDINPKRRMVNASRMRNKYPFMVLGDVSITIPLGYEAWIFCLDENMGKVGVSSSWTSAPITKEVVTALSPSTV